MKWSLEQAVVTVLLLLFLTHFYVPILQPVQSVLFAPSSEDQSVLGQAIALTVWAIAGGVMLRSRQLLLARERGVLWILAFAAFALCSAFWSQDYSITLRKSVFLLCTTAFGIYFGRRFSIDCQMQMICFTGLGAALASIGLALFLPKYGIDHSAHEGVWVGIFTQKNVCAREMLFLMATVLSWRPAEAKLRKCRFLAFFAIAIVIIGTQSKTGLLIMAALLLFFPMLALIRGMSRGVVFLASAVSIAAVSAGCIVAASALPRLVELLGRDDTMTGRTEIWRAVLQSIWKHPLLGYGFAAFWLSLRGESANIILALRWAVPAAHNGFLEIWLQLGAIGLGLFTAGFLLALRSAVRGARQMSFSRAAWPLAILLLTLIYNLDESSLMQPNDFLWVVYVATLANLSISGGEQPLPTAQRPRLHTQPA